MLPHQKESQDRASIQFLIRAHAGMTSTLQRRLLASPGRNSMRISVYTEGPYAGHRATLQPLAAADTVLCLVGGIGITNALGYVQEYMSANLQTGESPNKSRVIMKNAKRFIFAWSAREMALIEYVKTSFLTGKDFVDGFECSFWCTGPSNAAAAKELNSPDKDSQRPDSSTLGTMGTVTVGRMDIGNVIRSSLEEGHQTTVLVCGPGAMADEATRHVVNCVRMG